MTCCLVLTISRLLFFFVGLEKKKNSITLPSLPPLTTIALLREKIQEATKTTLPLSKMRLDLPPPSNKVLNNKQTLASVNLKSGDGLVLAVRK